MQLTTEQHEAMYQEIMQFCDLAENIIDAIELEETQNKNLQATLAMPVIQQVQDSAEVLGDAYIRFYENGAKPSIADKKNMEGAIRKIFNAVLTYTGELKAYNA